MLPSGIRVNFLVLPLITIENYIGRIFFKERIPPVYSEQSEW